MVEIEVLGSRPDFGSPQGTKEEFDKGDKLMLPPLDGFMLNLIPTNRRSTFGLWNFDPNPLNPRKTDPVPQPYTYTMWGRSSFDTIDYGHGLLSICGYVLDRLPKTGEYWLWSFDPSSAMPLALPAIQSGRWTDIDETHQLVVLGDRVLDWLPSDRSYRLWALDPKSENPLTGPLASGALPTQFDEKTTLVGVPALIPVNPARAKEPGSIDFMRDKVKHVVYLMLENRSFDHVLGWLYRKGETGINFVGRDGDFDRASLEMFVHHSDRGSQYVSIKYTERLAEAGIEPSVGSVGDSYDNALAETINGLYKAEVIHRRGPWRSFQAVEFATLEWVDWFNNRRLLEPIGNIPPAEAEERYYAVTEQPAMAA